MIKLGIPVIEQLDLTMTCIDYLNENCSNPANVQVVVIDNGSTTRYPRDWSERDWGIKVSTIRNRINYGYYWPLLQVIDGTTPADIVGLMHNDLFIYEQGWDQRIIDSFVNNPRLGMIGACGSNEVDDRGGRGGGTMCNFVGRVGQLQEHTGKRITGLCQALVLDSLLMVMRRPVVDVLKINEHIVPCHFYDKIWPMRVIHSGMFVGVLGLAVDHQGGLTSTGTRFESDCEMWCQKEGFDFEPGSNPASLVVYLEAERRWLDEFRGRGIPGRVPITWHNLQS